MVRNYKLAIFLVLLVCLTVSVSAEGSLDEIKQNTQATLYQLCSNCTYVNLTSVKFPDSSILTVGVLMDKNGEDYTYGFNQTSQLGSYQYNVCGDKNGEVKCEPLYFTVTPSGFTDSIGFYIIVLLIISGLIFLGFYVRDGWFVVAGGMLLLIYGVYSINNGIAGQKDMFLTWGIGLFEIFMGGYLSMRASFEIMQE